MNGKPHIETPEEEESDSFRDHIGTVDEKGKRKWIYPKKPGGKWHSYRNYLSIVYLILFFGIPFLQPNDKPLFLFNIVEKKFILFGTIFWPQDFFIFGLGMLIFIVFIALFTVAFGRIFCGWACPQTVFMEMVFRKIEYWIEGDHISQRKLAESPWNSKKIGIKSSKWFVFLGISYLIANAFSAYIIGIQELKKVYVEPFSAHKGMFTFLFIFTVLFFFIYSWFREQVCLIACPYGRMQGVLLDKQSIVVAYDYTRGEPRQKLGKHRNHYSGDCVNCNLCVKVCPTGIDIRNGTQLECINCTACIDACNEVMDKIGYEKGLIRYASEWGILEKKKLRFGTRMKAYSAVLILLIGLEVFLIASRSDYSVQVQRAKGLLYQELEDNKISNLFTIQLLNKTNDSFPITLKLENMSGEIKWIGKPIEMKKESVGNGEFFIILDKNKLSTRKTKLQIGVYKNNVLIKKVKTNFLSAFSAQKQ